MEGNSLFCLILYDYKYLANLQTSSFLLSSRIKEYFVSLFDENGIDINAVDEVFVSNSGAYCLFELFLIIMKVPYSLVEFSKNEFASKRLLKSINQYEEISSSYCDLVFTYGAVIGNNRCCKNHIYYSESDVDGSLPGQMCYFDPIDIASLSKDKKDKILTSYLTIDYKKCCEVLILLIPNSESLTKRALAVYGKYVKDIIAPYTLLIDLLGIPSERLIIKPHPHGVFSFDLYFPQSILLDKTFPIEFLQLIPGCRIKTLISIETSASDKIYNLVEKNIAASRYWMLRISDIIPLYVSLKLENTLLNYNIIHFYSNVVGIKEIAYVLSKHWEKKGVVITDQKIHLNSNDLAVTLNYEEAIWFSSCLHKYSIIMKKSSESPVLFCSRSNLYLAGQISSTECREAETTFCLLHSGLEIILKYEGEC